LYLKSPDGEKKESQRGNLTKRHVLGALNQGEGKVT